MRGNRRRSVRTYLIAGFLLCVLAVVAVIGAAGRGAFQRERARAVALLRSAAESTAGYMSPDDYNVDTIFTPLAASDGIRSFDPQQCRNALAALEQATTSAHVHVLGPDGREVCSVRGEGLRPEPLQAGPWFRAGIEAGELQMDTAPLIDPLGDQPAVMATAPVAGAGGVGLLVGIVFTGSPPPDVPPGSPRGTVLVMLDPERDLVLARTKGAPVDVGGRVGDTALGRSLHGGTTIEDVDGVRRIYDEVAVGESGWWMLAGTPESSALAPAWRELRRMAAIGGLAVLFILGLGVMLHRRLAKPVVRLGRAIEASWRGDDTARAPVDGPREVADVAVVFNDLIGERQAREADLRRRATHDVLTGLRNRAGLEPEVERAVESGTGSVLFLDLDRFKLINDTHGHAIGDEVLVAIAGRLRRLARGDVTVGRFGGDEFVFVCGAVRDVEGALDIADRVIEAVSRPVELRDAELFVGGSIGIAMVRSGATADDIIRDADTAMYHAKASAPGTAVVFDDAMWERTATRLAIERDLHQAIDRGELSLHFQPLFEVATSRPAGAEALLRWHHPTRGDVPPALFVPVAEETGQIVAIGQWVLREAVRQAAAWRTTVATRIPVSVNVSATQLVAGDLVAQVRRALRAHDLPPDLLVVEITESALVTDVAGTARILAELRDLGVGVSIDDFGTGYSSLAYLQQLPVDEVKVDRTFVERIDHDPVSQTIVRAVVDLGRVLGVRIVAEGVETTEQLAHLRSLGCHEAQGFLLARPGPPVEVEPVLGPALAAPTLTE